MVKHPTTNPFAFFLHALFSLIAGAFVAALTALIQLTGSGTASLSALLLTGFSAFVTYFGAGFVMLEKAPETKAAVAQVDQTVVQHLNALETSHGTLINRVEQLVSGFRQIAAQPAPPQNTVSVAPPNVPQQPFPGQPFAPNAPAQPLNWTGLTQAVTP